MSRQNLVACADLKPISQKELRDFSRNARQTNLTYKQKPRREFGKSLNFKAPPADLHTAPGTSTDFCRNWRRYLKTDGEKRGCVSRCRQCVCSVVDYITTYLTLAGVTHRYLTLTGVQKLGEIFKSDLDADLFAEIVHVLVATWKSDLQADDQAGFAVDALEALSKTDRLSLVLDFLDNNQQEKLQTLIGLLETSAVAADSGSRLAALKSKFKI